MPRTPPPTSIDRMTTNDPRPPGRPLYRTRDDRVFAGVAAGIGYWLDIDPVIVRVLFAVLAVFGGVGIVLYVVGWLFIPEVGSAASPAESWLAGRRLRRPTGATLAALIAVAVVVGITASNHLAVVVVLAAVLVLAVLSNRGRGPGTPATGYGARSGGPRGPGPTWYASPAPPTAPPTAPPAGPAAPPTAGSHLRPSGEPDATGDRADPASTTTAPLTVPLRPPAGPDPAGPTAPGDPEAAEPPGPGDAGADPDARTDGYGATNQDTRPYGPAGPYPADPYGPTADPYGADPYLTDPYLTDPYGSDPYAPAEAARRQRWARRRSTSRIVLGAAAVAAGVALLLDRLDGVHLTTTQLLAIPLAVLGAALAVTAVVGRSWLAIGIGLALTAAVLGSVAVGGNFSGRTVTWTPTSAADLARGYHLDAGQARLDLTHLTDPAGQHVDADVGAGQLTVLVPAGVPVRAETDAGIGSLDVLGDGDAGISPNRTVTDAGYSDSTGIRLDLHVGVGDVEVSRG